MPRPPNICLGVASLRYFLVSLGGSDSTVWDFGLVTSIDRDVGSNRRGSPRQFRVREGRLRRCSSIRIVAGPRVPAHRLCATEAHRALERGLELSLQGSLCAYRRSPLGAFDTHTHTSAWQCIVAPSACLMPVGVRSHLSAWWCVGSLPRSARHLLAWLGDQQEAQQEIQETPNRSADKRSMERTRAFKCLGSSWHIVDPPDGSQR